MQHTIQVTNLPENMAPANTDDIQDLTAGHALRHKLFNILTPIMLGSDQVSDAATRLMIQACCKQMVSTVESLIEVYDLDEQVKFQK